MTRSLEGADYKKELKAETWGLIHVYRLRDSNNNNNNNKEWSKSEIQGTDIIGFNGNKILSTDLLWTPQQPGLHSSTAPDYIRGISICLIDNYMWLEIQTGNTLNNLAAAYKRKHEGIVHIK